jgi:hypothetical protein
VSSKNEGRSGSLTEEVIRQLFERFSLPIVESCITPSQRRSAVGIAKTLWLRFVTGTDTEESIYDDLKHVLGDKHDDIIALGSTYFFRMKTALTDEEVRQLKDHYSDDRNFANLENWEP